MAQRAACAVALFVRTLATYYAEIGRPLPQFGPGPESGVEGAHA